MRPSFCMPKMGKMNETERKKLQYEELKKYIYTTSQSRRNTDTPGVIPDPYRFIDEKCFMNNGKVHSVVLPKSCRVIGKQAFEGCQFQKEVFFPESVVSINERAFAENQRLKKVNFPKNLRRLGKECYKDCKSLTSVMFDEECTIRQIPEGVFDSCLRLKQVCLPDGINTIGTRAFYRCKELKELHLPAKLKKIGKEAFYFCGFEELELPEGLEYLGESAFFRCKNLKKIRIPTSVKHIDKWVFHGCNNLEYIEILRDPDYIGEWIVNKSCKVRCIRGSKVDMYCRSTGFEREYISAEEQKNG